MLAAIAVIWFLLFVPAWTKRSEAKDQQVRESREVRDRLARSVTSGVALKASRAARTKNISLVFLILSVAVGVVALIQAAPVVSIACAPIALISLALAIMNILPIPALDGGRWFVTMLFRLMRKPLTKELEEKIHGTGFMILMAMFVLVTIADVGKFSK